MSRRHLTKSVCGVCSGVERIVLLALLMLTRFAGLPRHFHMHADGRHVQPVDLDLHSIAADLHRHAFLR